MNLVLLGPPGAGKGTQAGNLSKHYNITHISTGNLLREEMNIKSLVGLEVESLLNSGKFAPDQIVIGLLEKFLKQNKPNGFILDGFPRNIYQAQVTEDVVGKIDWVVEIILEDSFIVKRMVGRVICLSCGKIYNNEYLKPNKDGICDKCGHTLVQRNDDRPWAVKERLNIYHETTKPITDFFEKKNLLLKVSGEGDANEITRLIVRKLGEKL